MWDMNEAPDEVKSLVLLRRLVTGLTAVMIVGFIVLIGFLVTQFPGRGGLKIPDVISLPDGTRAVAFTVTEKWYAVVTGEDQILVFDRASGSLIQTVEIGEK